MHEQTSTTKAVYADLPPCCGTGCAVCVLDLIEEQAAVNAAPAAETDHCAPAVNRAAVVETVECCNTGCLICVRDYPELGCQTAPDPQLLQLLEAIETAQQT